MSDLVDRLPNACKMRGHSVYASDLDCKACGLGEGEACDAYIRASAIGFTSQPRPNILDNVTAGAWVVGSENAALKAEIERLTAELASALAKVAQYEQAPVVGWVCDDFIQDPCGSASCHNCGKRRSAHIIARPEVTK